MVDQTPQARAMAATVAEHAPYLKLAGFRKRRHGFNRDAADGLVHLVHFWMAPKEPPTWTEVPGLRERRYGSFRLDFGVYVPEMTRMGTPRSSWINVYDCQLHETVGRLLTGEWSEFWWRLDDPAASEEAGDALRNVGLPWLDRFPDATSILDKFDRAGPLEIGTHPAGGLDVADLCRGRGDAARERRILEAYVSAPILLGHVDHLRGYLHQHGHDDLVARITTR